MSAKTILIVDDDPDVRKVMGIRLKTSGYRVLEASGGKEGIKMAEKKKPDLIILDVVMPDITGYGVSMYLRENEQTKQIPIIMITGQRLDPKDVRLGEGTGVTYYMEKPYNPEQLLVRVAFALQAGKRGRVSDRDTDS